MEPGGCVDNYAISEFGLAGITATNTSPISALLRVLAISNPRQPVKAIGHSTTIVVDATTEDESSASAMLLPLDEWMSHRDKSDMTVLRNSLLVTSPGMVSIKDDEEEEDEESTVTGTAVKDLLGGIGRDNLPSKNAEDLDACHIYSISAQTTRAARAPQAQLQVQAASSSSSSSSAADLLESQSTSVGSPDQSAVLRCFVHERVTRDLKARSEPISFLVDIVKEKIVGGAFIREKQQYQKLVGKNVYELRIDEKLRVLYARLRNSVLIIEIVWNHKLDRPIKRAVHEMGVMLNWMASSGYADEEPFVMIDWVSGRLRPLYSLDISYNSESGEGVKTSPGTGTCTGVFDPTMLDLVLSPQQKIACEHAMAFTPEDISTENRYQDNLKDPEYDHLPRVAVSMPIITVVIFQGSAGNGKTTCLLRSGLSRAKDEQKVVFIAATRIFADSVEQDLKGSLTTDFRIMVRDNFKNLIRTAFRIELSENELGHTDTTLEEVVKWLDDVESRRGKKTDLGAKRAISDWLMKGHRIAADTANYTLYIDIYKAWKKENKKRDEGDLWNDVIPMLSAENAAGENTESVVNADLIGGATSRLSNLVRECDSLVIDEAQLYPAETYFTALMLWYRPRKALLLGMDSKQAVYLGCSNRKALLRAVDAAGWHDRMVRYYTLTTNFRLPARLVALSNAMVKTLRKLFPKVFDEYQMDEGFEVRSSSADTLVAAESTDAPVRAIERFPAMLVIGEAAVELRKQICHRMAVNRLSVLSVRFADISSESNDPSAERKLSGCTLADLPTIKFQAVSGLEISLPVIVDSLLTTYIEKLCPRRIMSAVKRGDKVEGHEMNMLRTALCTVYTVLTRCRGPLIWLEDDLKTDLTKSHPLVTMLREALAGGKMDIDFVTDRSEIDKVFVDRLFNSTDAVEVNAAFEESTCQILQKFKTSFFASVDKLTSLLEKEKKTFKGVRGGNVPSNLQKSDEYLALIEDRDLLLSQLTVSTHRGAEECRIFIRSVPDTLLLHAGSGDGSWTLKWGPHHKNLMRAFQLFPKTSRLVLGTASRLITPSPIDITDTGGQVRKYSIEQHLSKQALRICTCGEEPRSDHLQFVLAFNAGQVQLGTTALPSTSEASECVWVVHHVTAKEDRSVKCITEGSFLLSCFASKALDATSATDFHTRMSTMIYRFENQTELTITRATDGWLTLRETTLDPATGLLCQHTGVNAGMKCRCRARGASLLGAARAHSFGPYVREIGGNVSGFLSKGGRQKEPISSEVFLMPPVGDERMISLLANLFAGKESSLDALSSDLSLPSQTKTATVSQHYTAAAFVWNNLLGGKLLFAGVEARLQPWALLLPAVLSNMSASQRANLEVKNIDVAAFALLDQVRRTVEAHLQEGSYAVVPSEYVGN